MLTTTPVLCPATQVSCTFANTTIFEMQSGGNKPSSNRAAWLSLRLLFVYIGTPSPSIAVNNFWKLWESSIRILWGTGQGLWITLIRYLIPPFNSESIFLTFQFPFFRFPEGVISCALSRSGLIRTTRRLRLSLKSFHYILFVCKENLKRSLQSIIRPSC